ncbi:hypothetical protein FRB96_001747 [Tulasnella sp. 330]|nr:hypothetical protein FRB96_001747 [Tulasnella sp. 330]
MDTSPGHNPLSNYQLGDSLGKGAFGQVYRALNWTTGETVAVKQIQLSNIPKTELGEIMSEIDLLKNLNHANIVKYKGYVKTRENLYIILEYCENGSLNNICKRFGKFPENLVGVYISQVLEGLVYLHDQGVIHRDIKGANILTNKDGTVKLADFGVAATPTGGITDAAVVGSPYWMAPEVIEQTGATTASDIWSVGCVVIELLEGKPPYHFLRPMPALFRIVQDDCPPIPEGASPVVKDFLYHCFQKDCNLRISAKKLLRHPWMISTRRQLGTEKRAVGERPRPSSHYDDAVQQVQEWNEALKSPSRSVATGARQTPRIEMRDPRFSSPTPAAADASRRMSAVPPVPLGMGVPLLSEKMMQPAVLQQPEEQTDNWDDDFEEGIPYSKLQSMDKSMVEEDKTQEDAKAEEYENVKTIKPDVRNSSLRSLRKVPQLEMPPIIEDYSDLAGDDDAEQLLQEKVAKFKAKHVKGNGLFHPDDIKTVGLNGSGSSHKHSQSLSTSVHTNGSSSQPNTPFDHSSIRKVSAGSTSSGRSQLSPLPSPSIIPTPLPGHQRSASSSGSFGRSEVRSVPAASSELGRYTEAEEEDYDDIFAKPSGQSTEPSMQTLQLHTRSNKSWLGDGDSDEEDPFAEIDEGFADNDLETNLVRDKLARLCSTVNTLVEQLEPSAPDYALREACDGLLAILEDAPEMHHQLVSSHGLLAIVDVLEGSPSREVIAKLLRIVNLLVLTDVGTLEGFCLIGGIPVVMTFTTKKYSSECRLEASHFVRLLCHSSVLTLQMFISCRGLKVLVDLLDEDYAEQTDLVVHALNGIGSVFELQSPTPKNDFCRMFIREGLLDPLSSALLNVMAARGQSSSDMKYKIIQILLVFCQVSQSDGPVRTALGTRKIIRRLLRACELLEPEHLVMMLKAAKHLSMNATMLDVLQNANAIEILVRVLDEQSAGPHSAVSSMQLALKGSTNNTPTSDFQEISNHIFQTCFNLCRLNKLRQEEAAQAGIIPLLKRVIETNSPLKQFALPILCDLASAGKSCRTLLWQHDGLSLYLQLLSDPYFQVSAMESIHFWLQDETARVEDQLTRSDGVKALLSCFVSAKTNTFENLLDPILKILRISSNVAISIAKPEFFRRLTDRIKHAGKAIVRLNLLRILRVVCDAHPDRALVVAKYGMLEVVERLSQKDAAVMVRELAREILPTFGPASPPPGESALTPKAGAIPKRRRVRRTASEVSFGSLGLSTSSNGSSNNSLSVTSNGLPSRVPLATRGVPLRSKTEVGWQPPQPRSAS